MKKEKKKKDNVVRKGYNTYLQKLEKDKQKLSELLTNKNIPKPTHAEAPKIKEESLPNLNKKERTDVPIDNERDAFLFKKQVAVTEEKKEKKDEKETTDQSKQVPVTKKVVPVTDVFKVKTKKHRGINTIDELEKKTGGSPKVAPKEDEQKKDYKPNQPLEKDNNQKSWDRERDNENKQQGNTQDQKQWDRDRDNENKQQRPPRNDNYRGNNRDDNRGQRNRPRKGVQFGRGEFDIGSTDDFPSLSDNIEVPSKPFWLPNQSQQ